MYMKHGGVGEPAAQMWQVREAGQAEPCQGMVVMLMRMRIDGSMSHDS